MLQVKVGKKCMEGTLLRTPVHKHFEIAVERLPISSLNMAIKAHMVLEKERDIAGQRKTMKETMFAWTVLKDWDYESSQGSRKFRAIDFSLFIT